VPQAFIDRKLPTVLWIDPSRILQIIMNLLSNSLKFTKRGGKIHIYVTWCPSSYSSEQLLSPTENFAANENHRSQSSHLFSSQLNIPSPERKDPDALAFEEFNKREARDKLKNFQAIKQFRVNNLNLSTISTSLKGIIMTLRLNLGLYVGSECFQVSLCPLHKTTKQDF